VAIQIPGERIKIRNCPVLQDKFLPRDQKSCYWRKRSRQWERNWTELGAHLDGEEWGEIVVMWERSRPRRGRRLRDEQSIKNGRIAPGERVGLCRAAKEIEDFLTDPCGEKAFCLPGRRAV